MSDAARLRSTVYVGGLETTVDQKTLLEAFLPFGEVVQVSLPKPEAPSSTERHRGFGYVEFENASDAREAIDNMDQSEIFGRVIKVATAKPQKDSSAGLGSKVAVWEQEGWLARSAGAEEGKINENEDARPNSGADNPMQELEKQGFAGPQPA